MIDEMETAVNRPDTAIYVHLPFCRLRCSYCSFAISTDTSLEERYFDALNREVTMRLEGRPRSASIYLGGGTPSLSTPKRVAKLMYQLRDLTVVDQQAEITLEANPEDITSENLETWIEVGINRLSIGVQSFHDDELRPLGRVHLREGAIDAIALASDSPLRISIDLIAGLPRQTPASLMLSVDEAIGLEVGHVSLYLLDLEPGSVLERRVGQHWVSLPEDESSALSYVEACNRLADAGLFQYEISNFARPGEQSRHNLRYWNRLPYLGFGLGAHSFDGRRRLANTREIGDYMATLARGELAVDFVEELSDEDVRHERLFLGLRQSTGIATDEFEELTGEGGAEWRQTGVVQGWLVDSDERVAFSPEGFLLSNEYISALF